MSYTKQQITVEFTGYSAIAVACDNQNTAKEIAAHVSKKGIAVEIADQTVVIIADRVADVQALLGEVGFSFEAQYPNNRSKYSRQSRPAA
jgi:hypothetical protein